MAVDRWQYAVEVLFPPIDRKRYLKRRRAFCKDGVLAHSKDEREINLRLPIILPDGRDAGSVTADLLLRLTESGGYLLTGDIRGNGLHSLRALLGDDRAGPVGLDKHRNVVGPTCDLTPDDLQDCVASLSAGVAVTFTAVSDLTGHDVASLPLAALRLRGLEFSRDRVCPRASVLAQRVTRGCFDASKTSLRSLGIELLTTSDERSHAWLRVRTAKRGSELKVYAKTADLLRTEWVLDRRADVTATLGALVGHPRNDPADLLANAFDLAAAELSEFEQWVDEVGQGTATNVDLLIALTPLAEVCRSTERRRGRAPASPLADQAKIILASLMTTGRALTPGLKEGPLKHVLTGLVGDGVLVPGRGRRVAFAVAPRFVSGLDLRIDVAG